MSGTQALLFRPVRRLVPGASNVNLVGVEGMGLVCNILVQGLLSFLSWSRAYNASEAARGMHGGLRIATSSRFGHCSLVFLSLLFSMPRVFLLSLTGHCNSLRLL